jgi:hypothetical protein
MAVITVNQIIDNIDSFVSNIKKLSKSYYLFVGRPNSWSDDNIPPAANASVEQSELSIYHDMVYGKLIANTDVSYMIRKVQWANNTVYAQYSQNDPALFDKDFYVLTDTGGIYKCIYNNANAMSTIKPNLTTTSGTFKTSDGYIWKYMFTVETAANTKFSTPSYVPVTTNNDVESSAACGTIDYIKLTNAGNNYQIYETGFLVGVANNGYVAALPNTSSSNTDYYVNSSIYLKAGGSAGQIRNVTQYDGVNKLLLVNTPFDVKVNLTLTDVPPILVGHVVSQNSVDIAYLYKKGYVMVGNNVVQSDTGAAGVITTANSSHLIITKNNASNAFSLSLPIYNTASAGVAKSGLVRVISGNNFVIANGSTAFATDYAVNDFINVGDDANTQIRRVTSVNSTIVIVDAAFTANLTSNVHYSVPSAVIPSSISVTNRYGTVSYTNLTGVRVDISNTTPAGASFIAGEKVTQVDVNDVDQGANGVIAFSNSSSIELSSIVGTFTAGLYVRGQSSNTRSYIDAVTSFPNITVSNPIGSFESGQPIYVKTSGGAPIGNSVVLATSTTPGPLTEYVISPKVTITGDGSNALAYAYVDTSNNNPTRQITEVVMINNGSGYTEANVVITSNGQYGSAAVAEAAISPIAGHGANSYMELGSKYVGISVTFANGANESYKFPIGGEFRRVGIIEDPTFNDATLTLDTFDRVKLYLGTNNGISFTPGEVAYQSNTAKAGIVVYSNSSYLELKNVLGTGSGLPFFTAATNNSNTAIKGLTSGAQANVLTTAANNMANSSVSYFRLLSDVESVSEVTSGATATISQIISNTSIRVSNIKGHFNANDTLLDATTNAYANVVTITIANGAINATSDFGHKFTQTCRIPLTSNTGAFQQFEDVTQNSSNAVGTVLSFNSDRDIMLSSNLVSVINGDMLTSTSGGTAIALYSNGIYIRCVGANGTIAAGDTLSKGNTTVGTISNTYPVLVLYNVYGDFSEGNNQIVGSNSGAIGVSSLANTIWQPELVRNSGLTTYLENILPFERSNTSVEKINIIVKF